MRGGDKSKSSGFLFGQTGAAPSRSSPYAHMPVCPYAHMPVCPFAMRLAPRCTSNSTSQVPLHVLGRLHHVVYTLLGKGTEPARLVRQLCRLIPCFARLLAQERLLVLGLSKLPAGVSSRAAVARTRVEKGMDLGFGNIATAPSSPN